MPFVARAFGHGLGINRSPGGRRFGKLGSAEFRGSVAAGPVSRILSARLGMALDRGPPLCRASQDGHSSGPRIAARLKRPTRKCLRAGAGAHSPPLKRAVNSKQEAESEILEVSSLALPAAPSATAKFLPYLVLLRVGFALPAPLLERRCALTAPFHPYPAVMSRSLFAARRSQRQSKLGASKTGAARLLLVEEASVTHQRRVANDSRRRGGIFSVALSVSRP